MSIAQTTILRSLLKAPLLTEHELTKAVAERTKKPATEVQPLIGGWLLALKDEGLIWAGQMFNKERQFMWSACLTKAGRERAKDAGTTQS